MGRSRPAEHISRTPGANAISIPRAGKLDGRKGAFGSYALGTNVNVPATAVRGRIDAVTLPRPSWPLVGAIAVTLLAAALRLIALGHATSNPYYDAAVRSMGLSWHNFFYAAFDPAGRLAIDKPPVDLWLQVASVKILGQGPRALILPQALAATLAVPLLFDTVRRVAGNAAGVLAALALAVLPVSVETARSDTMDSVMMALCVLAAWLAVRAVQTGRARWLYFAAIAMGTSFEVKLLEGLFALPAIAVIYAIAAPHPWRKRLLHGAIGVGRLRARRTLVADRSHARGARPRALCDRLHRRLRVERDLLLQRH